MYIASFPSSYLSFLSLLLASFIDGQRTVTRDACAIARSVENSCTARFSIDRAKVGLDTTQTTPPVITYYAVDVVRCFCCLDEAPLTPMWSSCAAKIESASPEKDQYLENLDGCLGFEACRAETVTPAACHIMSDWVMGCSSSVRPETMPSSERFSRMEDCLCPMSAPDDFNSAYEACINWAWTHKPEFGSSMQPFAPYWCGYNLDTMTYSATATSYVSFEEYSSTASAPMSMPPMPNPAIPTSTMNSAIPSSVVASQATNSSGQPATSIVIVIALVVIVFIMVGGIAIYSSLKQPRNDHGIPI